MWPAILGGAAAIAEGLMGSHSQSRANRTNIKLQREQQAWEQMMSNTAVTRRAKDIANAGGNPALAFTTGSEASTPSLTPARVEPTVKEGTFNLGQKMMLMTQMKNVQADTRAKNAEALSKEVQARIDAAGEKSSTELKINRNIEEFEWNDLKTKILRNTETSTAAQAKQARETVEDLVRQVKQQVAAGKLQLDQLERISNLQGLTPKDVMQIILHFFKD